MQEIENRCDCVNIGTVRGRLRAVRCGRGAGTELAYLGDQYASLVRSCRAPLHNTTRHMQYAQIATWPGDTIFTLNPPFIPE